VQETLRDLRQQKAYSIQALVSFYCLTDSMDMIDSESIMYSNSSFSFLHRLRFHWYRCQHILRLLYAQQELKQLYAWAQHKRLTTVGSAYERKLSQAESDLAALQLQSPQTAQVAILLYWVNRLVSTEPRYTKGYAAKYRTARIA